MNEQKDFQMSLRIIRSLANAIEAAVSPNANRSGSFKYIEGQETSKRSVQAFAKAIEGKQGEFADNTVLYTTTGLSWREALKALHKQNIPAVAFQNNIDNTVLICVPKDCDREAAAVIAEINRVFGKDTRFELPRNEFMQKHKGEEVEKHKGLSFDELAAFRARMENQSVEYCVEQQRKGGANVYTLYVDKNGADAAQKAILLGKIDAMSGNSEYIHAQNKQREAAVREALGNYKDESRTVFFADAKNPETTLYKLSKDGLTKYADGKATVIARNNGSPDFSAYLNATVYNAVKNMDVPVVSVKTAKEARVLENKRHLRALDVINQEETAKVLAGMALLEGNNGRIQEASILAGKIFGLIIDTGASVQGKGAVESLNSVIVGNGLGALSYAQHQDDEFIDDKAEYAKTLKERFDALGLTTEEKSEVMSVVRSAISDTTLMQSSVAISVSDLGLSDIDQHLRETDELEIPENERETERESGHGIDEGNDLPDIPVFDLSDE